MQMQNKIIRLTTPRTNFFAFSRSELIKRLRLGGKQQKQL